MLNRKKRLIIAISALIMMLAFTNYSYAGITIPGGTLVVKGDGGVTNEGGVTKICPITSTNDCVTLTVEGPIVIDKGAPKTNPIVEVYVHDQQTTIQCQLSEIFESIKDRISSINID
jgi:hypothetical protein